MATIVRLGPTDHGRPMTFDEFIAGNYEEGHRYELIEGGLYVTPMPNYSHDWVEQHVFRQLWQYSESHPRIINRVTNKARVFLPRIGTVSAPEPDIAAYHNLPQGPIVDWQQVSPILVVEIMGGGDDEKDLVRNVDLYLCVPTIQEYWIIDIRRDASQPGLIVHRRQDTGWQVFHFESSYVYTTTLLPAFELRIGGTA